jgi:hypothetical protein
MVEEAGQRWISVQQDHSLLISHLKRASDWWFEQSPYWIVVAKEA